jgi:DNA-binding beta-propeller fold protein YncE
VKSSRMWKRLTLAITAAGITSALLAGGAQASHFVNLATISVPGGLQASPYPSSIAVSGLTGKVAKVNPTISGLNNEFDDVQMLLVGPSGQTTLLWRAVCQNALNFNGPTYLFDDAGAELPATNCPGSGTYKPTDRDLSPEPFTAPAPQGQPYGTALSAFNGTLPNGTWNLFIESTQAGGSGSINGGWSLDIETVPDAVQTKKKKCKKKKHRSAGSAKKKKCKKKKR